MRIALITHQWPGARLGGIGTYTLQCARGLAEAGHEAHVFTLKLPEDVRRAVPRGVVMHEVEDLAQRVASEALPGVLGAAVHAGGEAVYRLAIGAVLCDELRRVHGEAAFDVVEAPEYEALGLPLVMAPSPALPGAVLVTHVHSGTAVMHAGMSEFLPSGPAGEGAGRVSEEMLLEALEFASVVGADGLCAPSAQVLRDTEKFCPLGDAGGGGAEVVPLPFFADAVEPWTAPPGDGAVVYIGRLEMVKGAHLLPGALNPFLRRNPGARVRLAGPDTATAPLAGGGSMATWIRERLDRDVAPRVEFLGEQNREQLAVELKNATFVIVPSLFDSYSYVCCESLGAGRAVVVSDGIGASEVVGNAGITFERGNSAALAEAMARLWRDRAAGGATEKFGKIGYERARTVLSARRTIQQRIAFYERVRERQRDRTVSERLAMLPARYVGPVMQALFRVTAFAAGVPDKTMRTPGMRLTAIMDAAASGKPVQVLLYGAGRHTSRLLAEKHLWEQKGHRVVGLIDDHPRFAEKAMHLGLPVMSVARMEAGGPTDTVVVLSTDTFQEQFWEQTAALRRRGVRVRKLYEP